MSFSSIQDIPVDKVLFEKLILLLNKIADRILSLFFGNFVDKKTFIDTDDLFL